jgi:hypothetical protein
MKPGDTLAHYEIRAPLGKGGMGEVFQATDTKLGRDVALKILPEDLPGMANRPKCRASRSHGWRRPASLERKGVLKRIGGGGGNRTRVRNRYSANVYMHSDLLFNLTGGQITLRPPG